MMVSTRVFQYILLASTGIFFFSCRNPNSFEELEFIEPTEISYDSIPRDTIQITLTPKDQLLWNNVEIDTLNFSDSIRAIVIRSIDSGKRTKKFYSLGLQNISNYVIYLNTYRQTKYGFYKYVLNKYEMELDRIRNDYAIKLFGQQIYELNENEFVEIRTIIGNSLIENPVLDL
ncbi:hypothetical protein K6119_09725 [Paracrocinitomix mangrovi]|uniref:hypothetical protein n=1 Tax=Paracrocinitomix mangrovi TaxID=2862509 RepID=UPI001C8EC785|nr:hypothetical protein [Paracrocinitomix mangrovi]UKN03768.1 hypothetical protein K6119_09725 [Paracrocinitomix mangrovi]